MQDIQGSLMTRSHMMIGFNEGKLINGANLPIMGKIHHSKERGHYNLTIMGKIHHSNRVGAN